MLAELLGKEYMHPIAMPWHALNRNSYGGTYVIVCRLDEFHLKSGIPHLYNLELLCS